jgi:CMP-N-acetylneuraminic acid synthetase
MNMVALIPARAGSKRCPGKNTRELAGHPLIAYTIAAAMESGVFAAVWVCTDSREVTAATTGTGARFVMREPVADDQPDIDWVRPILAGRVEEFHAFAILRPTSPFRTAATIQRAYNQFKRSEVHSLRAVQPVKEHPGKMWTWEGAGYPIVPVLEAGWRETPPQPRCRCTRPDPNAYRRFTSRTAASKWRGPTSCRASTASAETRSRRSSPKALRASTSTMKTISQRLHGWSQKAASHSLNYQHARLISRLRRSTKPILVGPFRGEVGFEVLYWIPWLRYLRETLKIAPERIIPIGRAGSACWYGCPTGVELYSLRTPQDLRLVNRINQQKYGMLKQIYYDAFDKAVVQDVAESLNLTDYELIHPRHMYRTLAAYWAGDRGFAWLMNRVGYVFPLPTVPLDVKLPEKFVAVRFYGRSTFPASPQTTDLAQATIEQLARQHPVVLLNNGLHADEHQDFHISGPEHHDDPRLRVDHGSRQFASREQRHGEGDGLCRDIWRAGAARAVTRETVGQLLHGRHWRGDGGGTLESLDRTQSAVGGAVSGAARE